VAHTYNPSYSEGRNQDCRQTVPETLSQKIKNHRKDLVEWLKQ
jgi:hypothetical protein